MNILYTAEATVEGGREGHGRTSDGRLDVDLSVPEEMGGRGGSGTNPEQLFAVGYAACFQSALLSVAQGRNLDASPSTCTHRTCHERVPRRSWPVRTSSARTRMRRGATSMSPSWSTARHWNDRPPDRGRKSL